MRSKALIAIATLAVALMLTMMIEERRLRAEATRTAEISLRATNLVAERDSTRDLAFTTRRVVTAIGDSLAAVEKRVLQVIQVRDGLDRALGRERIARYQMTTTADSLRRIASAASVADSVDGTRYARFDVREAPYTVGADVLVPRPPGVARLALTVALDAVPVEARITCSAQNREGIRTASIVATSPRWASVRFDRVEQGPGLCASPGLAQAGRTSSRRRFVPLVLGVGRVLTATGSGGWGVFLGAGWAALM